MRASMHGLLGELNAQWLASARLRLFAWLALGIALVFALQLALEAVDHRREENRSLSAELTRTRAIAKEIYWTSRQKDASQLTAALAGMTWNESEAALSEAAFQDWLRSLAAKLALNPRVLTVARVDDASATGAASTIKPGGAEAGQFMAAPDQYVALRARVSFEVKRSAMMTFLAELARNERSVVVERMSFNAMTQPPMVELDLRALARKTPGAPR